MNHVRRWDGERAREGMRRKEGRQEGRKEGRKVDSDSEIENR